MRILHLSFGDSKGAFYGAYRTHKNLERYGHDSTMCVLEKTSNDDTVIEVSCWWKKLFFFFNKVFRRLSVKINEKNDKTFLFYFKQIPIENLMRVYRKSPDLIIIYYVAGFLTDEDIGKLQEYYNCPVAFYLMDAGMLTGGCHYPWDCTGYTQYCSECPAVNVFFKAMPQRLLERRKIIYNNMDCFFLSGSNWLNSKICQSSINPRFGSRLALMGIDERMFKPRNRSEAEKILKLSLPIGHKVILLGAQSLRDTRKGFVYLLEALKTIRGKSPTILSNVTLLTVGNTIDSDVYDGLSNVNVPFIKEKDKYPLIYNLADVFVCSSIEDAGPMMINESLSSGTPVISFDVGVASNLIENDVSGFISPDISAIALAEMIIRFLNLDDKAILAMKENSRNIALERTSAKTQVDSIVDACNFVTKINRII